MAKLPFIDKFWLWETRIDLQERYESGNWQEFFLQPTSLDWHWKEGFFRWQVSGYFLFYWEVNLFELSKKLNAEVVEVQAHFVEKMYMREKYA